MSAGRPPLSGADVVRAFLGKMLAECPGPILSGAVVYRAYVGWCRRERTAPLGSAAFRDAVAGLLAPGSVTPQGALLRHTFKDPIAGFLATDTRPAPGFFLSTGALYRRYADWCTDTGERPLTPGHLNVRVAALLGQDLTRLDGARGPTWLWSGIALDDGLPVEAVAPGDLTDAAELRALPADAREVA
ncbi:hypothetical protein [Methylobacterium sp. WSM2598]|uniref:hypothetical protein n=1 Tax=Methylobacterium sp. WSM2598 TaxID=398261 RepID=UPI00035E0C9B|nr:hypothetical protein [Methylobacterium sp. WSM2598]